MSKLVVLGLSLILSASMAQAEGGVKKSGDGLLNSLSKVGMSIKNSVCKKGDTKCANAQSKAKSAANSAQKTVKGK